MKQSIRIASGQGFWGDLQTAPIGQVRNGPVDYMMMDYLAEVTMSILQKQKMKSPHLGYAKDVMPLFEEILPDIVKKNISVITNGGGVNPIACRDAIFAVAEKLKIKNLKIGVVLGDNILGDIDALAAQGIRLDNMETKESLASIRSNVISANVYFGAFPIVEALRQGAQIVITGRTTDTGLTLAPMIYEFGWNENRLGQDLPQERSRGIFWNAAARRAEEIFPQTGNPFQISPISDFRSPKPSGRDGRHHQT